VDKARSLPHGAFRHEPHQNGALSVALRVIDADSARIGIHGEAVYFGVQKSMIGLSVVAFSQLEGSLGLLGLRWISVMAGGLWLLGLLGFLGYRPRLIKFRVSIPSSGLSAVSS
jgi:hypothetical protein